MSLIPSVGIIEVLILGGLAGMVSLIVAIVVAVIVKSQR